MAVLYFAKCTVQFETLQKKIIQNYFISVSEGHEREFCDNEALTSIILCHMILDLK